MEHDPTPVKGIHISRMNWITSLATLALYVLLTVTVVSVSGIIQSNYQDVGSFTACNQMGEMFQEGSRYLTEQVRLYVTTEDPARMEDYFFEIHTQRRRDGAANVLEYFDLEEETAAYLQSALDRSNALVEREIYAMALAALAQGAGEEALPQEVRDAPLTPEDRALPRDRLMDKARELVFGAEYQAADYPARIGGDEFAVIVMDAPPEEREAIAAKIAAINELLTHPDDGLPPPRPSAWGARSPARALTQCCSTRQMKPCTR